MSSANASSEHDTTGQKLKTEASKTGKENGWLSYIVPSMQRKITKLNYDLIEECKRCKEDSSLSKTICDELESYCRDIRREIVKKMRNGCAPLFIACKRGCVPIAEYLVTVCEADIEQRGLYEVPEDRTFHYVTPLWCAVVSGKLPMVKYLIRIGCDINATSDSGSTPVRSACFMTHVEIVQYLVEAGADIKKPNMNGGTCLINSVQSIQLCLYLIKKGADVNAKDIQEKTALHYAIQEHRLETTKLLLEHGADPYVKSRYGDDALRTACIKGANQIFDYLKTHLEYSPERIAEAHELIGSTFLDEHNETRVAILHWRLAHHIRASHTPYLEKQPRVPLRPAYGNAVEFTTLEELDNIATDMDAMRIQSLLICERILGITHKDMLFRLTFRGASYADSLQLQRCIDLWRLLLEVRVTHCSVLHFDTCYAAQALVRLMIDLHERYMRNRNQRANEISPALLQGEANAVKEEPLPLFEDVFGVFCLLTDTIADAQELLLVRPVYRKQQENFDRILKCIAHLIYLLINTANTHEQKKSVFCAVRELVRANVRSACTCDTLLHLCVSRLNVIKSGYLSDENNLTIVFPNANVIKLLLDCGMNVNAKNEAKSTPLHVAVQPYNYSNDIILLLLEHGADLDQPNKSDERPFNLIVSNPANTIPLMNYMNLKCLSATIISKYKIPYRDQIPKLLEEFVKQHEP
ncbi:PREDICTED: protein fem-1 homolog C [Rhagoletis zephyria]|uniref:protein fem-1 homolog C n=1 Tax=Rhagoletis zephyria TaxID=28612 RepID=UPI0008112B54|nr:PREDICTED: protein fem-1 homolog C [Rhagoletis zephyria]